MYPLVLREGSWEPFEVDDAHPLSTELRGFSQMQNWCDYQETKSPLQELVGEETFVAEFTVVERNDRLESYCVWTKDVRSLLPKTDLVAFASSKGGLGMSHKLVTWEDAERVAGYLLQPHDGYPRRFLVEGFPTPGELDVMKELQ